MDHLSRNLRTCLAFGTVALATAGWVQTAEADDASNHQAYQTRPIELGVSGSSIEFLEVNGQFYCYAGTLGALVEGASDPTQLYVLSNNHVLARENEASIGEDVIQPGLLDENGIPNACSVAGTNYTPYIVGSLSNWVPLVFKPLPVGKSDNVVDAAIAAVSGADVDSGGFIRDIGTLNPNTAAAVIDMPVMKSGRTTGLTHGHVAAVDVSVAVQYNGGYGLFKKQIRVVPDDEPAFILGGDSGSLLVTDPADGSAPQAVGLLFAGNAGGTDTFANPIDEVLGQLNVNMAGCAADLGCGSGGGSSGGGGGKKGGGGNGGGGNGGGGRPAFEFEPFGLDVARAAKAAHESMLFTIQGVVGVGVGVDENDNAVIEIYVDSGGRMPAVSEFPERLDGVEVNVIDTGVIRAY